MIITEIDLTKVVERLKKYNYNPKKINLKNVKKIGENTYIYTIILNFSKFKTEKSLFYKLVFKYYHRIIYNGDYLIRKAYPIGYLYDSNTNLIIIHFLMKKEEVLKIYQLRRITRKVNISPKNEFAKELVNILSNTIELKILKNNNIWNSIKE